MLCRWKQSSLTYHDIMTTGHWEWLLPQHQQTDWYGLQHGSEWYKIERFHEDHIFIFIVVCFRWLPCSWLLSRRSLHQRLGSEVSQSQDHQLGLHRRTSAGCLWSAQVSGRESQTVWLHEETPQLWSLHQLDPEHPGPGQSHSHMIQYNTSEDNSWNTVGDTPFLDCTVKCTEEVGV